jgi:nucleotide-binding universal stress UspA family protein
MAYKRILIPTDGSKIAAKAIRDGVALARALGAGVVGYHAVEPIETIYYTRAAGVRASQIKAVERELEAQAQRYLDAIRTAAATAGVPCETRVSRPAAPWQGIVDTARRRKCDAICMASHGRGRIASALLGNETQKVLVHSKVPVLVCR